MVSPVTHTHTHTSMRECITRTMRKTTIRTLMHITLIRTFTRISHGEMILHLNSHFHHSRIPINQIKGHLMHISLLIKDVTPRPRGEGVSLCWGPYHKHVSL